MTVQLITAFDSALPKGVLPNLGAMGEKGMWSARDLLSQTLKTGVDPSARLRDLASELLKRHDLAVSESLLLQCDALETFEMFSPEWKPLLMQDHRIRMYFFGPMIDTAARWIPHFPRNLLKSTGRPLNPFCKSFPWTN